MTTDAVRAGTPRAATLPSNVLTWATLVAGCLALLSRPVSDAFVPITVVVAVAGAMHGGSERSGSLAGTRSWLVAVAIGVTAFALARGALGPSLFPPATGWLAVSVTVAAIAEELFFRRFVYDAFLRWGAAAAIAGSSVTFALVHVTSWGWRAIPVDLAAGVLLAWQRMTTGSWTAPAVTHVVANMLILS